MSCEHAHDDGAYVLGALSPAERAAFEAHLAACPRCRNAVAELAALPGLLARLDATSAERVVRAAEEAERSAAPAEPAEPLQLPRLLAAAAQHRRRDRKRRRWQAALAGLATAGLTVAVGIGVAAVRHGESAPPPQTQVAMTPMVPAATSSAGRVTAEIALTGVAGGTRVRVHCTYAGAASPGSTARPYTFRLVAYDNGGEAEQVVSWQAARGQEMSLEGMTRFAPEDLNRLELQRADGSPLLVYTVA